MLSQTRIIDEKCKNYLKILNNKFIENYKGYILTKSIKKNNLITYLNSNINPKHNPKIPFIFALSISFFLGYQFRSFIN